MLEPKMTYIYSIEGKDLYNKILKIKEGKKFKAALDYSLEAIQIEKVAKEVYENKEYANNVFYQEKDGKQYTNKVINLTFKYNVKEYNLVTVKNIDYYIYYNYEIDNDKIPLLNFSEGIYKDTKNNILVVKLASETNLTSKDLPQGFGVKNNKIHLTATGLKTILTADDVREHIYINGFKLKIGKEVIKYVRFKRSSGSSRVGKCLFIDERLYELMEKWSMMGIKFEENEEIDLAALEAYISLTTSSIIDTIHISPKNILLIDDYESSFEDMVMVTKIKKENYKDKEENVKQRDVLHTEPRKINIKNSIWDGQSLIDISLLKNYYNNKFEYKSLLMNNKRFMKKVFNIEIDKYTDKGMLLLRNRFFKSCCFGCDIQRFFEDNNITDISQLNGKTLATNIKDIKLITTPNSIKYLKFGSWDNYLRQLDNCFGIVKYDKPTHYFNGKMVQCHYQLLNTLQLTKDDTKKLLEPSLKYIDDLKNNNIVLRHHLKMKIDNGISCGDINNTNEFIFSILSLNENFYNTDLCYKFKKDLIESYINNIKKGHILLNGNYSVLCGNGIEMLMHSCKDNETGKSIFKSLLNEKSILDKDEVYCANFDLNKPLIASRSPHITMSNVWLPKNTNKEKAELINKYFNVTNQIVYINSIGNNVLELLSGCDFDSDQILLSDSELLIQKAELNYNNFLVSTNKVEAQKVKRENTAKQKSDLDIKTSKNLIGEIVNCSAYLNSQLWHKVNSGQYKITDKYIQELYKAISQLNVMSCIEIDKAKKEFSIDNQMELDRIRTKWCENEKPIFFKQFAKERIDKLNNKIKKINKTREDEDKIDKKLVRNEKFKPFKCTLDYLVDVMSNIKRMNKQNNVFNIGELLIDNNIKISSNDINTFKSVISKVIETKNKCNSIWNSTDLTTDNKFIEYKNEQEKLINVLQNINITKGVLKRIFKDLDKELKSKQSLKKIKNIEKQLENLDKKLIELNKDDMGKKVINTYVKKRNILVNEIKKESQLTIEDSTILSIQRLLLTSLFKSHKDIFLDLFKENKKEMKYIIDIEKNNNLNGEKIKLYYYNYLIS